MSRVRRKEVMKKRVIKFYGWADFLMDDSMPFEEQVEFEWDEKTDVMAPAFAALDKAMDRYKEMIQYSVSDWWWVE
jgi:hypothetical protein